MVSKICNAFDRPSCVGPYYHSSCRDFKNVAQEALRADHIIFFAALWHALREDSSNVACIVVYDASCMHILVLPSVPDTKQ